MTMKQKPAIAFFGTPDLAVEALAVLKERGFAPTVIITAPDKPKGRKLVLTPSPVKIWAKAHGIPVLQPETLKSAFRKELAAYAPDLFVVAAYGKILGPKLLAMPAYGTLNIHPSLLPEYRGSSPVEQAILDGRTESGVTVMVLDEELDHGPIVAQKRMLLGGAERAGSLKLDMFKMGAEMLADIIPPWIAGEAAAAAQDHERATFTPKIRKEDGLIDPEGDQEKNWRMFRAYDGWPGVHFFAKKQDGSRIRVVVVDASFSGGTFDIARVVPEGRKEMEYADFLRGIRSN